MPPVLLAVESKRQHQQEEVFTKSAINHANRLVPCLNHIIWHVNDDHNSRFTEDISRACFNHTYELPIFSFFGHRTQGYMFCSLENGTFVHDGDSGWINWAMVGNWKKFDDDGNSDDDGNVVKFEPISLGKSLSLK